jgi:hypothetical protein
LPSEAQARSDGEPACIRNVLICVIFIYVLPGCRSLL